MARNRLRGTRTGGAGIRRHPVSDKTYKRARQRLLALNAADADQKTGEAEDDEW